MMVENWKTHSNERKGMAKKRTILIDGRRLENTLDKEDKDEKRTILIGGWKTHTKRKKNRVGKHAIFSLWLRVGKHT